MNQIHLKIRPYVCEQCGDDFYSKELLNKHLDKSHPNVRYFHCDENDCRFRSKDSKTIEGIY